MYSNSYKMLYVTTLYHKIATMYSIIHTGLIHSDDVHTGPVTLSCDLPCDHVTMSIVWSMHVETHVRCHVCVMCVWFHCLLLLWIAVCMFALINTLICTYIIERARVIQVTL